jgi:hypothetical protein
MKPLDQRKIDPRVYAPNFAMEITPGQQDFPDIQSPSAEPLNDAGPNDTGFTDLQPDPTPQLPPPSYGVPNMLDNPVAGNQRQEGKPFAFALAHGTGGASIWHGCLLTSITVIRVFRENGKNYILSQDPIPKLTYTPASNLNTDLRLQTHLGWYGNVYAYWEVDENGTVTLFDIRGPTAPTGEDISELQEDLTRTTPEGKYFLLIGTVDGNSPVVQKVSSDITWAVTILAGSQDSSSGSEASEDSTPSGGSGSEAEKSSNAIVEGPWAKGKFVALATMESNQVLFEFIVRDIRIRGRRTMVRIDPRFMYVCEPNSLCVAAAPCGDLPYPVGANVVSNVLILTGQARADRRPKTVNVRLTGLRKGFKDWDMPSRTAKQKAQSEAARRREYDR